MSNLFEAFKKFEVKADSVEDFLKRYTKHSRHYGRGADYAAHRIKSFTEELKKCGYTFISKHDSVTGEVVSYYGLAN
ncbi:hypothetical protein NBRC13296_12260 [Paenibacillus chitinolyticus]|uniref:hypothetical protein n=1 Tax=Paenibacillus chitinolyticus TaxID=79263 RepID=UPI003556CDE1